MTTMLRAAPTGAEWMARETRRPMSLLGRRVADLLGDAFGSLCVLEQLERVNWRDEHQIDVPVFRSLDTVRGNLSRLVVLAHTHGLALTVQPRSNTSLTLRFALDRDRPMARLAELLTDLG